MSARMRKPSKAALRREQAAKDHQRVLERWFAISRTTMDELIATIERLQPDENDPAARAGIDANIIEPVTAHPRLTPDARIRVCRAIQHVAITRPWRPAAARHDA